MFIVSENSISISDYDHSGNIKELSLLRNQGDMSNVWHIDLCIENSKVY